MRTYAVILFLALIPAAPAQPPADDPLPPGAVARFGTLHGRHVGPRHVETVTAVAVTPDGKTLASTTGRNGVLLWDAATGRPLGKLDIPGAYVYVLAFSPDGKRLAYVGNDRVGINGVLDVAGNKVLWQATGGTFVAFLPDGTLLALSPQGQVALLDAATGKERRSFGVRDDGWYCIQAVVSRDGKTVAAFRQFHSTRATQLVVWDATTGQEWCRVPDVSHYTQVSLSPDGKVLAVTDGGLRLLDTRTGKELRPAEKDVKRNCTVSAFAPDGKTLAVVDTWQGPVQSGPMPTTIRLLDPATGKERGRFAGNLAVGTTLRFSPDGGRLLCGGPGCAVWAWDIATGTHAAAFDGHCAPVHCLRFTADGKTLVTCDPRLDVRWWDLATRRQTGRLECAKAAVLDVGLDGKTVAAVGHGKSIELLGADGKARFTVAEFGARVRLSPDGKQVVWAGHDGVLHLLDAATGKELRRLEGHTSGPVALAFSADGKTLLSAAATNRNPPRPLIESPLPQPPPDDSVRLWDVATGKELRKWDVAAECAALSPDGRTVAIGADNKITLFDTATGKELRRMAGGPFSVRAVAFAPDGRSLAAAGDDGVVRWWEAATGQLRRQLAGHAAAVEALAFAPNGRLLASGSAATTALVWDVYGPTAAQRTAKELWADLHGDAGKFPAAVAGLRAQPKEALALLRKELQPIPVVPEQRIALRIADLNSAKFTVREAAARELEAWQERVEPHLRRVLAGTPSLELQRRVEALLAKLDAARLSPSTVEVRALRMLELLEHLGTPEARTLLQELAAGAPEARRTRAAQAALARLDAGK
jgi:WD40 repeat protein